MLRRFDSSDRDGEAVLPQFDAMSQSFGHFILGAVIASELLRPMLRDLKTECLAVAYLDISYRLLGLRLYEGAEASRMPVPIRELLRDALDIDSRRLLIAHNHPHGCAQPSHDDVRTTRELARVVRKADIRLVDHLVFAGDTCTSFRGLGLI